MSLLSLSPSPVALSDSSSPQGSQSRGPRQLLRRPPGRERARVFEQKIREFDQGSSWCLPLIILFFSASLSMRLKWTRISLNYTQEIGFLWDMAFVHFLSIEQMNEVCLVGIQPLSMDRLRRLPLRTISSGLAAAFVSSARFVFPVPFKSKSFGDVPL